MFGETLQKQVEDRLKFYETGDLPPKNAEVMHDAMLKAEEAKNKIIKKDKKKKKKNKKDKMDDDDVNGAAENEKGAPENGNYFYHPSRVLIICIFLLPKKNQLN